MSKNAFGMPRRTVLTALVAAPIGVAHARTRGRLPAADSDVVDFSRSYLHCSPKGLDIWVRTDIECRCQVLDRSGVVQDEYLLSVKAQTGLTRASDGQIAPGYEYWMIFSPSQVYIKRVRVSAYSDDPTIVPMEAFGKADWRIVRAPATPLRSATEVATAVSDWRRIVARSEFASAEKTHTVRIEYPVKWVDRSLDGTKFRVETGPVLLLDPEKVVPGKAPAFEAFRWAHLDYHSFDQVRCLMERPSDLLADVTWPASGTSNPPLATGDVAAIEDRLLSGWKPPVTQERMRQLLQTDRYTEAVTLAGRTTLFAV